MTKTDWAEQDREEADEAVTTWQLVWATSVVCRGGTGRADLVSCVALAITGARAAGYLQGVSEAQAKAREIAKDCKTCIHRGFRLTPDIYCQLHDKMASLMGNSCGKWIFLAISSSEGKQS